MIIILSILISLLIVCFSFKYFTFFYKLSKLPKAPNSWLYGDIKDLLPPPFGNRKDPIGVAARKFMEERCSKYWYKCKVFVFWTLWYPFVNVTDPETIEFVLKNFAKKPSVYFLLRVALRDGVFVSNGHKWKTRRKQLRPTLTRKVCEDFMEAFNETSVSFMEKWRMDTGKDIDVDTVYTRPVLEIVLKTIFRTETSEEDREKWSQFIIENMTKVDLLLTTYLNPLNWFTFGFNLVQKNRLLHLFNEYWKMMNWLLESVLTTHGKRFKDKLLIDTINDNNNQKTILETDNLDDINLESKTDAYVEVLSKMYFKNCLTENDSFNLDNLMEELTVALLGGFETTVRALTWTTFLLATHPEIQVKVRAEVDDLFADDPKRPVTMKDLKELIYLECCIKEAMRLFPALTFFAREAEKDFTANGYIIPKGVTVVIPVWSIHRNPNNYYQPNDYIPDRFLPENRGSTSPYLYLPFSAGARGCIGQWYSWFEMKVMMAHLLRNYILHSPINYAKFEYKFSFQQKAINPMLVRFEER